MKCRLRRESAFFCSSLVKSEPTWIKLETRERRRRKEKIFDAYEQRWNTFTKPTNGVFFSGHLCFFIWDKSYYEESEDVIFDTLDLASNLTARHKFDRQSLAGFYQPDEWCAVHTFYRLEFCWTYLFDVCLVGRFAY